VSLWTTWCAYPHGTKLMVAHGDEEKCRAEFDRQVTIGRADLIELFKTDLIVQVARKTPPSYEVEKFDV